ncbi:DNA methylase N-4/N-6 domain protein [Burkholderia pseudomallei MSHR5596]|nr:DNA methylase N-4/N-6 domain protein [Burkholderia pseudomallei MSHR5596]
MLPGAGERPRKNGGQGDSGIPESAKRARICRESPLQEQGAVRHSSRAAQWSGRQATAGERGLRVQRPTAGTDRRPGLA